MNWKLLLPTTANPWQAITGMFSGDSNGLSDGIIWITILLSVGTLLYALCRLAGSRLRVGRYLRALPASGDPDHVGQTVEAWARLDRLPLLAEFRRLLVTVRFPEAGGGRFYRRVGSSEEVFDERSLAHGLINNRFILATPGIVTGLGVLGTFVGLQLGIGALNLEGEALQKLDESIKPLIQGSAVAFSTSVWGVTCSLAFSLLEKGIESIARRRIRRLQDRANALIPRFTPEESLVGLSEAAQSSDETLKGLAGAIGKHMQEAIAQIGESIAAAVKKATEGGAEDLGKRSADLMSGALTGQLKTLGETVNGMAQRFETLFGGVSQKLTQSVDGFQPVVDKLNTAVEMSARAVGDAVGRLNSHEEVMREMSAVVQQLTGTATALEAWKGSLEVSAQRNEEAAKAQEKAASSNVRAADEFSKIGEKLPEVRETIEQAAAVIGSLGAPLLEFKRILDDLPGITVGVGGDLKNQGKEFSESLMRTSNELAEKVGKAAEEFGKVSGLAEKLAGAADTLHEASSRLEDFGVSIEDAAEKHRLSATASERAAVVNESVATKLGPLPASFAQLRDGLTVAGEAIRRGAETAQQSYQDAASAQETWLAGIGVKMEGMKARMQELIRSYSDEVEGQTRHLMQEWTKSVADCLKSYEAQVDQINGGLDDLQQALRKLNERLD